MSTEIIKEAVSVEAALDAISAELGVPVSEIDHEVLVEPSKKLFGMGSERHAEVKGWVRQEEEAEEVSTETVAEEEPETKEPESEETEFTDEQLDEVADTAIEILKNILKGFEIDEPTIEEYEGDDGEIILDVVGDDLAVLIGRHGRTLESLQMIVALMTTKKLGFRYPLTIDVEGYKHRRRQKLESIARSSATRALKTSGPVRLQPMNAYERRIVHLTLRDNDKIATSSEGEEPRRIVVVRPRR